MLERTNLFHVTVDLEQITEGGTVPINGILTGRTSLASLCRRLQLQWSVAIYIWESSLFLRMDYSI